jgi:hypothetical protein
MSGFAKGSQLHEKLRRKIDAMEKRYDARSQAVFRAIRRIVETPIPAKKAIGFHARFEYPLKSVKSTKTAVSYTK